VSDVPEGVVAERHVSLARHTPWRVGGPSDALLTVHGRHALPDAQAWCREHGWRRTLMGAGTRTVIRDGGLSGAMVRLGAGFSCWERGTAGYWVGAAVPLAALPELPGAPDAWSLLVDAPGSLGASITLDDGWEPWVRTVRFVHRGREREDDLAALRARGPNAWVVEVQLDLSPLEDPMEPGPVRPGSWYVPPKNDLVSDLMRQTATAGTRLRGVVIPEASPEMLVNVGGGTAKDLALLQKSAIERLHKETGVLLEGRMTWMGRIS
jgi:UDP-N-acetylenolpyruvoylglucosamine reductase